MVADGEERLGTRGASVATHVVLVAVLLGALAVAYAFIVQFTPLTFGRA